VILEAGGREARRQEIGNWRFRISNLKSLGSILPGKTGFDLLAIRFGV
jgi:hypothetical protein